MNDNSKLLAKAVNLAIARRGRRISDGQRFALHNACADGVLIVPHRNDVKTAKTWREACVETGYPFIVARRSATPTSRSEWTVTLDTTHCATPGKPPRLARDAGGLLHTLGQRLYSETVGQELHAFDGWLNGWGQRYG